MNKNGLNTNPMNIQFSHCLIQKSKNFEYENNYAVFKSINDILLLIFQNEMYSIIIFDIVDNRTINSIKNAHKNQINNIRHHLDKRNKRDLVISLSFDNLKVWNINNLNAYLSLKFLE